MTAAIIAKSQAELLDRAGWGEFRLRQREARAHPAATSAWALRNGLKGTGRGPFEMALVRVSGTGRVSVSTGASAIGQGLATALAQICAEELGMRAGGGDGCGRRFGGGARGAWRICQPTNRDGGKFRVARGARSCGKGQKSRGHADATAGLRA